MKIEISTPQQMLILIRGMVSYGALLSGWTWSRRHLANCANRRRSRPDKDLDEAGKPGCGYNTEYEETMPCRHPMVLGYSLCPTAQAAWAEWTFSKLGKRQKSGALLRRRLIGTSFRSLHCQRIVICSTARPFHSSCRAKVGPGSVGAFVLESSDKSHANPGVGTATRQDIARASIQTPGSRYGPKYPFTSIITCVVSVTNAFTEPPVPAGTIAAFAT